ncbi:hypothetical protein CPB84DRAFT_1797253 [Gymnopilus junonius]|uniref:DUF6593 domain-containing protein n=1 Tax=Gymnopilus junonius TaxID=109634 RepID=A0A9P5NC02_GYMJU|nr:hypothetical protein CPB84DRAFT_1797253 [Gymnopilus junonius]
MKASQPPSLNRSTSPPHNLTMTTTFLSPMESNPSQITLVAPESTSTLIFSKPSALNTILLLNGRPLYKIATVDAAAERTTIADAATGEMVVTIQRRDVLPSWVTFSERSVTGARKVKLREWLKEQEEGGPGAQWKMETVVGNFVWRVDELLRLALHPESNLDRPIAWAQAQTDVDPFALIATRATDPFREEIVASFLILEHRIRMEEKKAYLKERRFYRTRIATKLV